MTPRSATVLAVGIVVGTLFLLGSGYGVAAALVALVAIRLSRRWPVATWPGGRSALAVVAGCEFVAPVTSGHPLASSVGVQALCLFAVAIVLATVSRRRGRHDWENRLSSGRSTRCQLAAATAVTSRQVRTNSSRK